MNLRYKKIIEIRKTSFVRKGGRNYRYTSYALVSDGKNKIGIEKSKSKEISIATSKSLEKAEKKIFEIKLKDKTLKKKIKYKFLKTIIIIIPTKKNTGIIAGGNIRKIFKCTGIKNIICKIYGSKNKFNVIEGTKKILKCFYKKNEKKNNRKR